MQPGTVVADRFRIESLAGKGGMSQVYRAMDLAQNRVIALKVFTEREARSTDRFNREVRLLASLDHPAIVEHVAHGLFDNIPYMAMEWLEGEDLQVRLQRGTLSVEEVLELAYRVASAIGVAHDRGVVHRDVKPSNIFLTNKRIADAKLIDFGIARVHGGPQFTRFGEALGTPAYMAPEQARGSGEVDARADVFALGCVLFECLTGRPPFWADHPLAVMAKILLEEAPKLSSLCDAPSPLASLVQRMLSKDPADRPANGGALADAVSALQDRATEPGKLRATVVPKSTSLTSRELQPLSVVFVGRVGGVQATTGDGEPTLITEGSEGEIDRVLSQVLKFGGWAERLVDGSVVVTLPGRGAALEQAASAARCALAVQRVMPSHPMALVTGRAEVTGGSFPVGDVIERGVKLLASEKDRLVEADETRRGIVIDDVAAGLLDRRFEVETRQSLAGTPSLVLVSERVGADRARTLLGRVQPFLGRERELKRIMSLYDTSTGERTAQAVLVTGQRGVGKSRLAHELIQALEERHPTPVILVGRGDLDRRQIELGVLSNVVRELVGLQEQEGGDVARHRVRARIGRHVAKPERDRVAAFMGELVSVHFPRDTHPLLAAVRADRVRLGDQIRAAWEDFITAELHASPVVFIVEDMHHADAATVNLIDLALRNLADMPFLVVAFATPEVDDAFPQLWPARPLVRFDLPRLAPSSAAALVRHALGEETPDTTVERVVAQADGNAFYLEELVRAVSAGRAEHLPETILAVIQARLDELSPDARRVLRACSVFGESFTVGGVRALLGAQSAEEVALTLELLVDEELLTAPDAATTTSGEIRLGFRNALVREAAYASLTQEDRALGHRLAASWLERTSSARDAIVVANHLERAGDERLAAAWFARSAEVAIEGNDFEAAIARAERGVTAGATGPLLGRIRFLQAEALRYAGATERMLQRAQEAMTLLPRRTPPWWGAIANAIVATMRLGRNELLEELCDELREGPYEDLPAAATRVCHYLVFAGRAAIADPILDVAMQNMGAFNEDPGKWAWGYRAYASKAIMAGDTGQVAEQMSLAVRAFAAAGDVREVAMQGIDLAGAFNELGLYDEAHRVLLESMASGQKLELAALVSSSASHLGLVEGRLGNFEAAHAYFDQALPAFAEQRNRRLEGTCRIYLARMLLDEHRFEEGVEVAISACRLASTTPSHSAYAQAVAANLMLRVGREEEALELARQAISPLAAGREVDEGEAFIRVTHAEALMTAGDKDGARSALREAHERLLVRAGRIRDASWRRSFLERVPENARTIELVRAWLSTTA